MVFLIDDRFEKYIKDYDENGNENKFQISGWCKNKFKIYQKN